MTGVVESSTADDQSERAEARHGVEPTPEPVSLRGEASGLFAAIDGWRGVGWLSCGAAGGLAIAWFILLAPGETGSKSDWFFGAVVLGAVLILMWQTVNIQRQANQRAAEAADRLRHEMAAAEARSAAEVVAAEDRLARELAQNRKLHEAELESRQKTHRAELDAQRRQASLERTHLRSQLQKQAVIEVSRAVSLHTQMLATLWNRGAGILSSTDRVEREQAMLPIFEQIGQVVNDFSVELANAHKIVDDNRLNQALEGVNEAVLMGIQVAQDVCTDIVEGRASEPNPIPSVQRLMYEKAAEARRLAWDLLRTGLNDA
ncbi:hypothetical protein [Mycobacterium sp. ITM-2016-00318]|uniref:hypothetical protein n=1 Tax=Mycobacterium sp. ITM-2016-00318 TaxID=2099693 RepID=UPI001E5AC10A|nr:hypothetical protein [Mycobacterium sp. ITM-2016-00318]WNG92840.1 hypothetical protein C6A82_026365 [Mycobacterium sp. ITM-2016-00318]